MSKRNKETDTDVLSHMGPSVGKHTDEVGLTSLFLLCTSHLREPIYTVTVAMNIVKMTKITNLGNPNKVTLCPRRPEIRVSSPKIHSRDLKNKNLKLKDNVEQI